MRVKKELLLPTLADHPTVDLGLDVTPIQILPRLSDALGVSLLVKRDDVSLLAMGGNKVRQLEYYLGPARQMQADTVLITGAVQSNFVRLCAAAAAKMGWHAVVQLEQRVPKDDAQYNQSGNVLLNHILGAEVRYFPEGENEAAADASLDIIADELKRAGRKPYVVHLGIEHAPIGALGYANCAAECYTQLQNMDTMPDHVVLPSGSGLTHAGFLAGARTFGWGVPVYGICVRRDAFEQKVRIARRTDEVAKLLASALGIVGADILVDDSVLAPGYGQINPAVMSAITQSARLEALILDPVYSGRTMAGLKSLIEQGAIKRGDSVLFVHTGGLPSLFAYQTDLMQRL
ncbi:MAG: D-cysteine desulfhydrase family protein [Granulosicoccus sp.]